MKSNITVNGKSYAWPKQPLVVVCVDGCEPDYLTKAIAAGAMPWLAKVVKTGANLIGEMRGAELHQPEQPFHRHRRAALRARDLRQLSL